MKTIDSSNHKTAYVIGCAICIIPSQIIMIKYRPSIYLPTLELAWGITTGLMAAAKDANLIYAIRFLIGVCEASSYPGIVTILMMWYNPSELARRVAIFGTSYPAANIFVGAMQAALHSSMDGLSGWRWLFIFNGIMTVVVALAGYFLLPGSPSNTRVFWLGKDHMQIAKDRMEKIGRAVPTGLTSEKLGKAFKTWPLWVFTLAYSLIPTGAYVLQTAATLPPAHISDKTMRPFRQVTIQLMIVVAGCIILSIWPSSFSLKMTSFHLLFLSNSAGPILVGIIIGIAVAFVYAIDSFANIFIYPASEAPNYPVGYKVAAVFGAVCIYATWTMGRMWRRDM
ncbi:MFS general substrate transporter [Choiromyces venosus 120613-1]|uniref:MFS general substrate transporter n=1 Tax=Choiromyces venosus 120613-1 TaxID=1336337 RepID=A0A3N4JDI4_9PEZI|nr:MFS general substrate transporter [Choiromyces venosus 120613-1]